MASNKLVSEQLTDLEDTCEHKVKTPCVYN